MIPEAVSRYLFPHPTRLSLTACGLLLVLGFAMFLPGLFSLPPVDRDEALFAQASRQMVESGDWVTIRYRDAPRYQKPVGIYWLQAGVVNAAKTLGFQSAPQIIGLYRLPSLFAALLSLILTGMIGARLFGAKEGLVAALLLASCLVLNVEARLAKTDAALLACTLTCMLVLAKAYTRAGLPSPLKAKDVLLFWAALGVGFLIKGPVIFLAALGAPVVLRVTGENLRWLKPLRPLWGVALFLLITLPWFAAVAMHAEAGNLGKTASHDFFGKLVQPANWSASFPGYHAAMSWGVLWPASLPLWLSLPWLWRNWREPRLRFLLAWALPVWAAFEIAFAKLPHYILPAVPALMIVAAAWLMQKEHEGRPPRVWRAACLILFTLMSIVLCVIPAILPVFVENQIFFFPIFFSGLALGLSLAALQLLRRDHRRLAPWPLVAAGAILAFALFRFLFLDMPSVFLSSRLAEKLTPPGECVKTSLVIAGYREPSLVFLAGTDTKFVWTGEDAALALSADPCLTAAVTEEENISFKQTMERVTAKAEPIAEIKGRDYANGKKLVITLYQAGR